MMKKKVWILLIFMFLLSGCGTYTPKTVYTLNPGNDTIGIGETWIDSGMTIKYGGTLIEITVISNTINTDEIGTYEVIYEGVKDEITFQYTRYVFVVDLEAPTMVLNPGIDTILVGTEWIDSGVEAIDDVTEDVEIEVIGSVDTNVAGNYTITYKATDDAGNVSYLYRMVSVI